MVRPGASARFQLRPLRHETDPEVLCHASSPRERRFGCGEGGAHYVHQDAPVQLPGHNELYGPGHHVREMGEDIRRKADQVLAPLRVVRQPGQTGLSRPSALLALVLTTQERLRAIPRGVRGLQARVSRARHAEFWRLAGELQQSGRVSLSRGLGEDAGLLHGIGSRHLQRRGLPSRSVNAIHLAGHFEGAQCTRAILPWPRSIRHAEGGCGRRPQFGVHPQARGRPDPHPLPQIRRSAPHEAYPGLRRQFPLPKHDAP